ncbi:MAG TPA: MlaD family protein [Megamonas hypermegale]|uniref:MlaD family protein n=1 Tax=Megamonas hypermegale TaxID=158847 RepID=A0A921L7E8_9FIRM|nr:MlaD family protein [Megamonas hypermegale]MDM8143320.1 MlaD family protein [Megamonas hypermegale]HJF84764.1 MlaD family protein [Megamonas hypermegale]
MSNEAKVGIFTVIGLVLLTAIVLYLSGFNPAEEDDYSFDITFNQVTGLKPGAGVSYAGIAVGRVQAIEAYKDKAKVTVEIRGGTQIAKDSLFTINSDGLMGEKFISIMPPQHPSGVYLAGGESVQGVDEKGLDYLLAQAGTTLVDVQELIKSMNTILGNKNVQNSLVQTAVNLNELTGNMNELMRVMSNLAVNNQQDIDKMIRNLSAMTASMASAADEIDSMLNDFSGDGQTAENMKTAIANLAATSQSIQKMAANMEPVIADPATAQKLQNIIDNASNISTRADTMMNKVSNIKVKTGVDALYSGGESDWAVNADVRVYSNPNSFLLIGADDIGGDDSGTNLQVGTGNGTVTGRGGLIDDKVGVGIDFKTSDKTQFSVDAYDPDDLRVKLRGQYELADDTYLIGQIKDVNDSDDRAAYLGLRQEF